ncbi:MAG TPA: FAD-binding oxidoreductase [Verrucomicrobiae bacterium]|nr:FAD-binding oxidoreductase [Verrucomicrobiae bacterium]
MKVEELKKIIKGDVTDTKADLVRYSHDASIFEVEPQLVVFPKDADDVKQLVKFVSEKKSKDPSLSLTARAAGTDMSGGVLNDSLILDFTKYFKKIGEIHDHQVVVEPGVFYRDFEKVTLAQDLVFPSYPASKALCALGGMIANNSGGEKSLSYGKTLDHVKELSAVLSDGNEYSFGPISKEQLDKKMAQQNFEGKIYRDVYKLIEDNYDLIKSAKPSVSKNSAGYYLWEVWDHKTFDLSKLIVGSQGTLGIITRAKLNLIPVKKHSELLVMFLKDLKPLAEIVNVIKPYKPETFESFDDHTLSLAVRFLPDMVKRMKGNIIHLGLQFLPELWMVLTGGLPKLILIAEFTGDSENEVFDNLKKAEKEVQGKFGIKTHITRTPEETQKYWTIRRESFNLLRQHSSGLHTAPFIDDIVVHPKDLPEFLPKLNKIFSQYPHLIYTIAGHAGDANFHIIPLMDLAKEDQRQIIPKLSNEVYNLVLEYKGSITAEHNDGLIRTPYLEKMFGKQMVDIFAQVKNIFDPQNIFNPRKKIGATMDYVLSHIRHK